MSNELVIFIVIDALIVGGMERQLIELLKGLKSHGRYKVALAVLHRGGGLEEEAANLAEIFLPVERRARFDITPAIGLTWEGVKVRPRLIHSVGWMSSLVGLVTARLLGVPFINGSIRAAPPRLATYERLIKLMSQWADLMVTNAQANLKSYGLSDNPRARVILNGIDFRRFEKVIPEGNADFGVCMVANFSAYKDHATVIRAFPVIKKSFPEARLVLVGQDYGTLSDNRRLVKDLSLERAVRFITDTSKPEAYIAGARVGVLISNSSTHGEGISNAILEYMALSKPVIAGNWGGNLEVVQEGETGFLVPANSPEALAARVIELFQHPDRAKAMGEAGRRQVLERFSVQRLVAEYEALYDEVLGISPPSSVKGG